MTPTPEIHAATERNVVTFNPFTALDGKPGTNIAFFFESFEVNGSEDLFDGAQARGFGERCANLVSLREEVQFLRSSGSYTVTT